MALTYKNRMKQTESEINAAYPDRAKRLNKQGDAVFADAEFWDNKNDTFFNGAKFKLPKGVLPIDKWIKDSGLEKCKKSDAISLLIVGEKREGCFIIGKCKNYWLRAREENI